MLTIFDHCRRGKTSTSTNRGMLSGTGRRDFLRAGTLGLGGLSLQSLLATQVAASNLSHAVKDKSVIFLFMHGGPSQTETFDPKMMAPSNIRSATGEIKTSIPGVTFGGTFPKLARLATEFSIVRSFVTGDGNHDIKPIVSRHTNGANLGSLYSRVVGTNHGLTGMPTNAALFPRSVDGSTQKENLTFGDFSSTGSFGKGYAPFVPGGGGAFDDDLKLKLPMNRIDDRKGLLSKLDHLKRSLERDHSYDGIEELRSQAFNTIVSGTAAAFDLSDEDPRVIERYDTSHIARPENISRKWNNYNNYVDNGKTLGKLLLLARRLCERGCGFVTVTTNFVWDMHADQNNATMDEGMEYMGLPFDHAVSAFIEDCKSRGLSDKIMLVCCGEMGRTPRLNARGGRDHWGGLAPLMIYGGGLKTGQVIGESDREAARPATDPIGIDNLVSTILHTLFDVGELRLVRGIPREILQAASVPPIRELI